METNPRIVMIRKAKKDKERMLSLVLFITLLSIFQAKLGK